MFQCLSYLQNFILLKSVECIKSYRYLSALSLNSEFRFSRLRRHLKIITFVIQLGVNPVVVTYEERQTFGKVTDDLNF